MMLIVADRVKRQREKQRALRLDQAERYAELQRETAERQQMMDRRETPALEMPIATKEFGKNNPFRRTGVETQQGLEDEHALARRPDSESSEETPELGRAATDDNEVSGHADAKKRKKSGWRSKLPGRK